MSGTLIDAAVIEAAASVDLYDLVRQTVNLRRKTDTEYAGPCPFCPDAGEDRFIVHPAPWGELRYWCRQCGEEGNAIKYIQRRDGLSFQSAVAVLVAQDNAPLLSTAELAERRVEIEARRAESAAREAEHRAAAERHMAAAWRERDLQGRLLAHIGYIARLEAEGLTRHALETFGVGLGEHRDCPALVIPWTVTDGAGELHVRALQYRALEPTDWTYHYSRGSKPTLFNADCVTTPCDDSIIIVEGAKKTMSLYGHGFASVCGLSSKGAFRREWVSQFAKFDRVYVCLDPDAREQATTAARLIGDKARVVALRHKPDDFLVATRGDVDLFVHYLNSAVPA